MSDRFQPSKAIIMYEKDNYAYFESYGIVMNGSKFNFLEGHPLTPDDMMSIMKVTSEHANSQKFTLLGYVPDNLIFIDIPFCTKMAWWIPAGKMRMKFSSMKIKSANCMLPALLFYANHTTLSVFALKKNEKPMQDTELYNAPLHNIYGGGNVCMGNVAVKRIGKLREISVKMKAWEKAFFDSDFTSHGSVSFPGDILQLYKSLEKSKKDFPAGKMISFGKTVKQLINE